MSIFSAHFEIFQYNTSVVLFHIKEAVLLFLVGPNSWTKSTLFLDAEIISVKVSNKEDN